MTKLSGMSLVELMIVLAVGSLFIVISVPAYFNVVQSNRAVGITNKLVSHLNFARSEAIKRGSSVSLCPSNSAFSGCSGNSNWSNGWLVFIDPNGDGVLASLADRLKVQEPLPTGASITYGANSLTFNGDGFFQGNTATINVTAAGCTGNNARTITITGTGRLSVVIAACN